MRPCGAFGFGMRSSEFENGGLSVTSLSSSIFGRAAGPAPRPRCCAAIGIVRAPSISPTITVRRKRITVRRKRITVRLKPDTTYVGATYMGAYFNVSPHCNDGLRGCGLPRCIAAILCLYAEQISPGRNVLQWNAASVAERLPLWHTAGAIGQQVARRECISTCFVTQSRRDIDLLRLFRWRVVVHLRHPRERFRAAECTTARGGTTKQLFCRRIALRCEHIWCFCRRQRRK